MREDCDIWAVYIDTISQHTSRQAVQKAALSSHCLKQLTRRSQSGERPIQLIGVLDEPHIEKHASSGSREDYCTSWLACCVWEPADRLAKGYGSRHIRIEIKAEAYKRTSPCLHFRSGATCKPREIRISGLQHSHAAQFSRPSRWAFPGTYER